MPRPLAAMFLTNHDGLNNLGRGSPKKHSCRYIEIGPLVPDKKIFKLFYIDIWRPCFLTNHDNLNNLGRGSTWKDFYQVIMKSVQWFLTRRFLKFSL